MRILDTVIEELTERKVRFTLILDSAPRSQSELIALFTGPASPVRKWLTEKGHLTQSGKIRTPMRMVPIPKDLETERIAYGQFRVVAIIMFGDD